MSAAAKETGAPASDSKVRAAPRPKSWYSAQQWLDFASLMADHVDELEVEIAAIDEWLIPGQRDSIENMREVASRLRTLVADIRMQAQKDDEPKVRRARRTA